MQTAVGTAAATVGVMLGVATHDPATALGSTPAEQLTSLQDQQLDDEMDFRQDQLVDTAQEEGDLADALRGSDIVNDSPLDSPDDDGGLDVVDADDGLDAGLDTSTDLDGGIDGLDTSTDLDGGIDGLGGGPDGGPDGGTAL